MGLTNDQVDWVVPHQANIRIIDQVAARASYPKEKVLSEHRSRGQHVERVDSDFARRENARRHHQDERFGFDGGARRRRLVGRRARSYVM